MHYDFVALPDRKPLKWPGGARLALISELRTSTTLELAMLAVANREIRALVEAK